MREPFHIGGVDVAPGTRQTVELPVPGLAIDAPVSLQVEVIHGRRDGPRLFVSAAIHGDELNGVEIVRRLLRRSALRRLRGTLIAVPIVNVYGVVHGSRYLPDRRDLNRSYRPTVGCTGSHDAHFELSRGNADHFRIYALEK